MKYYFIKTPAKRFYNMARVEYRILNIDQATRGNVYFRFRDRLGVDFALGAPGPWYAVAAVEPFYRFDRDTIDPPRVRAGLGRLDQRLRARWNSTTKCSSRESNPTMTWNGPTISASEFRSCLPATSPAAAFVAVMSTSRWPSSAGSR